MRVEAGEGITTAVKLATTWQDLRTSRIIAVDLLQSYLNTPVQANAYSNMGFQGIRNNIRRSKMLELDPLLVRKL